MAYSKKRKGSRTKKANKTRGGRGVYNAATNALTRTVSFGTEAGQRVSQLSSNAVTTVGKMSENAYTGVGKMGKYATNRAGEYASSGLAQAGEMAQYGQNAVGRVGTSAVNMADYIRGEISKLVITPELYPHIVEIQYRILCREICAMKKDSKDSTEYNTKMATAKKMKTHLDLLRSNKFKEESKEFYKNSPYPEKCGQEEGSNTDTEDHVTV